MSARRYDPGPPAAFEALFGRCPPPTAFRDDFLFDWGPVFYRGRLDGSARILAIASDPGTTELLVRRSLVGNAGQRVQGFLAKIGLERSYVLANAFPYSFIPSHAPMAKAILRDKDQMDWRNELYHALVSPNIQAIVAFGTYAAYAIDKWPTVPALPIHRVPHPSSHSQAALLDGWRAAVTALRGQITPDPGVPSNLPNYGAKFLESDYAPIPRRDLPFGVPPFVGDDAWLRARGGFNSVTRPDDATLQWTRPTP